MAALFLAALVLVLAVLAGIGWLLWQMFRGGSSVAARAYAKLLQYVDATALFAGAMVFAVLYFWLGLTAQAFYFGVLARIEAVFLWPFQSLIPWPLIPLPFAVAALVTRLVDVGEGRTRALGRACQNRQQLEKDLAAARNETERVKQQTQNALAQTERAINTVKRHLTDAAERERLLTFQRDQLLAGAGGGGRLYREPEADDRAPPPAYPPEVEILPPEPAEADADDDMARLYGEG